MTSVDRFLHDEATRLLEADEVLEHTAYLVGTGALPGKAYFALLTDRRLLLIQTREGAFRPLQENRGVESIPREQIVAARLSRFPQTLTLVVADGEARELVFRVDRFARHVTGHRAFLAAVPTLVEAVDGAAVPLTSLQRLEALTPRVLVTPAIVALNVVVFVWMVASGVSAWDPSAFDLLAWGANHGPLTTGGEWWRLLASNYIHIGIFHLVINMWVLWSVGRVMERLVGNLGFLVLYTASGLLGSVVSMGWSSMTVSAGASGAIFGVFGCLLGLAVLQPSAVHQGPLGALKRDALIFIAYNVVFGLGDTGIDMAAHLGGLAAGFACGLVWGRSLESVTRQRRRRRSAVVAVVGAVAVLVGASIVPAASGSRLDPRAYQEESFGRNSVYYGEGATRDEARRLGEFLEQAGMFHTGAASDVVLVRNPEGYVLSLFVNRAIASDPDKHESARSLGDLVSDFVLAGEPTTVVLLDSRGREVAVLEPGDPDAPFDRAWLDWGRAPFLIHFDFTALRASAVFERYEPQIRAALGDELSEVREGCGVDLLTQLDSVTLEHRRDHPAGLLVVVSGIPRATVSRCIGWALQSTALLREEADYTLVRTRGPDLALRWTDARTFAFELTREASGPGVAGAERLAARQMVGAGAPEPSPLRDLVSAETFASALFWGEGVSMWMAAAVTDDLVLDAGFRAQEAQLVRGLVGLYVDQARQVPALAGLLGKLTVTDTGDGSTVHLALTESALVEVVTEIARDPLAVRWLLE